MLIAFGTLLIVWVLVLLIIRIFTRDTKIHLLFPVHFSLAIITVYICFKWFSSEKEFVFNYGLLWRCIERGSLEALTEALGIIGVGSVLLGWTYGERDKLTLGKRQDDMVHHIWGYGYALSFITHIGATVLCLIMLKCAALEASLWAFITVLWGFVSQVIICLVITLNGKRREKIALMLWERDRWEKKKSLVIQNMAEHLSNADVRNNGNYLDMMGRMVYDCLYDFYDDENTCDAISAEQLKAVSKIFCEITDRIPQRDKDLFEESIFRAVCARSGIIEPRRSRILALLAVGYYRFLYVSDKKELPNKIGRFVYYSQKQNPNSKLVGELLRECHHALAWYQFINQSASIPEYAGLAPRRNGCIETTFRQLVLSLFEGAESDIQYIATLAWDQIHSRGYKVC